MSHLERRRNLWYARLTVPVDARGKLGKFRFFQSLGTPDKAEAKILAAPLVAKWKATIRQARGVSNALHDEAQRWRQALKEQATTDRQMGDEDGMGTLELHEHLQNREEHIRRTKGPEVADTFGGLVEGKLTPTDSHREAWESQLDATPKTKDQMKKDLLILIARFSTLEGITKSSVKKWVEAMKAEGKSHATLDRIFVAARNYWRYLQAHDVVPMELTPFKGALELGKAADTKAKKRGKSANLPYDPKEVVSLYKAAVAGRGVRPSPDPELAALIKLGAYTGARIEELCSIEVSQIKKGTFYIEDAKTPAGVREVPIHSKLADLVNSLVKKGTPAGETSRSDHHLVGREGVGMRGWASQDRCLSAGRLGRT